MPIFSRPSLRASRSSPTMSTRRAGTPTSVRRKVWERLAGDLRPRHLAEKTRSVTLEQLPPDFDALLAAQGKGRTVVRFD